MGAGTNVRVGRAARVLIAPQPTYGTPVTNFSAATAVRAPVAEVDLGTSHSDPTWMSGGPSGAAVGGHEIPRLKQGTLSARCTPATVQSFLRAHGWAYAAGTFTLGTQLAERATMLFTEDRFAASARPVVRLSDAWFPRVNVDVNARRRVGFAAQYHAEASDVRPGNVLAGLTLPAYPLNIGDVNEFPGRSAVLTRDPAGANVTTPFDRLTVELVAEATTEWDLSRGKVRSHKAGFEVVRLTVAGRVNDETWALLTDARAGTRRRYRLTMTAPSPSTTWTWNFYEVAWDPAPLVVDGLEYQEFVAVGRALRDSSGNFVSITLA